MEIEELAVSAITTALSKTDLLKPFISKNDKEPIWDGHIYVYSNVAKNNKSLTGRIPVQVKGKSTKDISSTSTNFVVPVSSLEQFRKEGGAIFFVVLIDIKGITKIYYKELLPFNINYILENKTDQKGVTIKFDKFPTEIKEITSTLINFLRNKDKQKANRINRNWTFEEVNENWQKKRLNLLYQCQQASQMI